MNNFKQHMKDSYTHNELADMANHGSNNGHTGLIWTEDLLELFNHHKEALFEIMQDYAENTGEKGLPEYVMRHVESFESFAGAVVYFCAEYVAYDLTEGEYLRETEEA
jgi:hypothetical protein